MARGALPGAWRLRCREVLGELRAALPESERAPFSDVLRAWGLQAEQVRALRPVVVGLQASGSLTGRQASSFYDLLADLPD